LTPTANKSEVETPLLEVSSFARHQPVNQRKFSLRWVLAAAAAISFAIVLFSVFERKPAPPAAAAVHPSEVVAPSTVTAAPVPSTTLTPLKPQTATSAVIAANKRKEKKTSSSELVAAESEAKAEKDKARAGVLGFSPAEISSLLAKADQDAGDGRYDRAIFEYQTILKSEPGNAQAKDGLARAIRNKGSQ
jgi:hypothetical protein